MGKQFLYGCQQCGSLLLCLWSKVKYERLKRAFCLLYVGLQGILFCGTLEAAPAIPSNVRLESEDCSQMSVVVLKDDDRCGFTAGSEAKQSVIERGAELRASSSVTGLVVVAPSKVSDKSGHKQSGSDRGEIIEDTGDQIVHGMWFGLLIALPPFFYAMLGHAEG